MSLTEPSSRWLGYQHQYEQQSQTPAEPHWQRIWEHSDFIARFALRDPKAWQDFFTSDDAAATYVRGEHQQRLNQALANADNEKGLHQILRHFRQREMMRIAWRDLANLAGVEETIRDLSQLANACLIETLQWLERDTKRRPMIIVTLGKLGGQELNFSSDIDLMFAHKSKKDHRHYQKLAQQLIRALHQVTADGFVFRVDMRLRPFGHSGLLVPSLQQIAHYYHDQGRPWERYALQKATIIHGHPADTTSLNKIINHFVYRPYIDYSAHQTIREIHQQIDQHHHKKTAAQDVKLGFGGIRELEFIVQNLQLIHGGHNPKIRQVNWLNALSQLNKAQLISSEDNHLLKENYLFLRRVENHLQMVNDEQTHCLPQQRMARQHLAQSMGYPHWDQLQDHLNHCRQQNHHLFKLCLAIDKPRIKHLQTYANGEHPFTTLIEAVTSHIKNRDALRQTGIKLQHRLKQRQAYLRLLLEHPEILPELLQLLHDSPYLEQQLHQYPFILKNLTTGFTQIKPQAAESMLIHLQNQLNQFAPEDLEHRLEVMRHVKAEQSFAIAYSDITNALPLMKVSDHLSALAEAIISCCLQQAWHDTTTRYGQPAGLSPNDYGFAIIAYGKLGGLELSYQSDLDLVFLYQDSLGHTHGRKTLDPSSFYARLAQRLVHHLQIKTYSGKLYDIDLRLRPSGSSGLLVSSMHAFEQYQSEHAWTWEHQSLTRARMIHGNLELAKRFSFIRQQVLARPRDKKTLANDIRQMREKMRTTSHSLSIKQQPGGLIDLEFFVQYLVLANAKQHPELLTYSDNIRQLETLAQAQVIEPQTAKKLIAIYIAYRQSRHHRWLKKPPDTRTTSERSKLQAMPTLTSEKALIQDLWQTHIN